MKLYMWSLKYVWTELTGEMQSEHVLDYNQIYALSDDWIAEGKTRKHMPGSLSEAWKRTIIPVEDNNMSWDAWPINQGYLMIWPWFKQDCCMHLPSFTQCTFWNASDGGGDQWAHSIKSWETTLNGTALTRRYCSSGELNSVWKL